MSSARPMPATPIWETGKRRRAKHDSGPRKASVIRHVVVHSTEAGRPRASRRSSRPRRAPRRSRRRRPRVLPLRPRSRDPVGRARRQHDRAPRRALRVRPLDARDGSARRDSSARPRRLRSGAGRSIPRRWLTVAELRAGKAGLCRHADASRAFPDATRTPIPALALDVYLGYVRDRYAEIRPRARAPRRSESRGRAQGCEARQPPGAYDVRTASTYGTGLTTAPISTCTWGSTVGFVVPPSSSPRRTSPRCRARVLGVQDGQGQHLALVGAVADPGRDADRLRRQ